MFNKTEKTYSFSGEELSSLRQVDAYLAFRNAEIQMGKNMYGNIVDSALRRCGLIPEKVIKEGKKLDVSLEKGTFVLKDKPAEPQNNPPLKAE